MSILVLYYNYRSYDRKDFMQDKIIQILEFKNKDAKHHGILGLSKSGVVYIWLGVTTLDRLKGKWVKLASSPEKGEK